jgi:hypothetical protein
MKRTVRPRHCPRIHHSCMFEMQVPCQLVSLNVYAAEQSCRRCKSAYGRTVKAAERTCRCNLFLVKEQNKFATQRPHLAHVTRLGCLSKST